MKFALNVKDAENYNKTIVFLHKLDSVINKQVISNYKLGLRYDDINTKDDITRFDGMG
jgi:hypothetical protein